MFFVVRMLYFIVFRFFQDIKNKKQQKKIDLHFNQEIAKKVNIEFVITELMMVISRRKKMCATWSTVENT